MPITLGLRLTKFSQGERSPGMVIQSLPLRDCLPGLLADHALPFLDPAIEPRLWMGNRTVTPTHFDSQQNPEACRGVLDRPTTETVEKLHERARQNL